MWVIRQAGQFNRRIKYYLLFQFKKDLFCANVPNEFRPEKHEGLNIKVQVQVMILYWLGFCILEKIALKENNH